VTATVAPLSDLHHLRRWAISLSRARVTAALLAALVISTCLLRWGVSNPEAIERWASTNLVNLHHHPVGALVTSAFISPGGAPIDLAVLALACAVLELRVGARRMLAVIAMGQVLASLITEGAVLMSILAGDESTQAAWQMDVGISYVLYTAVGAALLYVPRPWRRLAVGAAVVYVAVQLAASWDMTAWGHAVSFAIGVCSWRLLRNGRASRTEIGDDLRAITEASA
jgi:hypothetical protein